jgi:hypothetical protein
MNIINTRLMKSILLVIFIMSISACTNSPTNNPTGSTLPEEQNSIYFPIQLEIFKNDPYPLALASGVIVLEDNCIRLKSASAENQSHLLIFPPGFSLKSDGSKIQIIDSNNEIIYYIGDTIEVGGGETTPDIIKRMTGRTVPSECKGPYFLVRPDSVKLKK